MNRRSFLGRLGVAIAAIPIARAIPEPRKTFEIVGPGPIKPIRGRTRRAIFVHENDGLILGNWAGNWAAIEIVVDPFCLRERSRLHDPVA